MVGKINYQMFLCGSVFGALIFLEIRLGLLFVQNIARIIYDLNLMTVYYYVAVPSLWYHGTFHFSSPVCRFSFLFLSLLIRSSYNIGLTFKVSLTYCTYSQIKLCFALSLLKVALQPVCPN